MELPQQIGVGLIVNAVLLFNAAGWPWHADGSFIMPAVSWNLFSFFAQFAESVNFFFEHDELWQQHHPRRCGTQSVSDIPVPPPRPPATCARPA